MNRSYFIFVLVLSIFLAEPAGNLPQQQVLSKPVDLYCYNCWICMNPYRYYGRDWFPRFYFWEDVWIAGSDNVGILFFYELPGPEDDTYGPPLLVYKSKGEPDSPEMARFLPAGQYLLLIDGECFHAYRKRCTDVIYFYLDDGTGPRRMSVDLKTDKKEYGREDTCAKFSLQVIDDETGEYIKVNSISGTILLSDSTEKTVTTEDWSWNNEEELYEYSWDFTNDEGEFSDPEEGFYSADMTVEKSFYQHVTASVTFGVCYHVEIMLNFNKDILEFSVGEPVEMMVCVTDEDGSPVDIGLESELILPDGKSIDLVWTQVNPGIYTTNYVPEQEGIHTITVGVKEDVTCFLEEAFGMFCVRDCLEAVVDIEIGNTIIDESVEFVLTFTDGNGNFLSGGEVIPILYLPDGSTAPVTWTDQGDGSYTGEYTPSSLGWHRLRGYVVVSDGTDCYRGFFDNLFEVTEKKWPDLVIRSEDIIVHPEPELGDTVLISVVVQNVGNADALNFWVAILINDEVVYREVVECLAAGESIVIEYEWTVLYTGGYIIQAVADPPEGLL